MVRRAPRRRRLVAVAAAALLTLVAYTTTYTASAVAAGTGTPISANAVAATDITVNGSLSEAAWKQGGTDLPYGLSKLVSGTWNNTAKYSVLWNSTYLYVGVRLTDAALHNDSANVWDDDSVEVYVDGNHNHGTTYDANDNQYVKGHNDTTLFAKNGNTAGVLHAVTAIAGGYEVELAIPWGNLGVAPATDKVVGFDVGNNDDDNGAGRDGQAVAFGTAANWTDTSAFGDAKLTGTPPPPSADITANPVATSDVQVNGSLSEAAWKHGGTDLPYGLSRVVSGTWNNTVRYSVLWDNTYLYVGFRVTDAALHNDSANVWDDDSVEVYVDGNHNHGTSYDTADNQYVKGHNDTLFAKNGNTTGALHAVTAVTGGYEVELAIPWGNLGITPATDKVVGFDVGNNDDDNGAGRDGQAVAFGTANNWTDTSGFGDLRLAGTPPPCAPAPYPAKFHTRGLTDFVDTNGCALKVYGFNIFPVFSDGNMNPEWYYTKIRDAGFNAVRFVIYWSDMEPSKGSYNETLLAKVDTAVGFARSNGLYVILDPIHLYQDTRFIPAWARTGDSVESIEANGEPYTKFMASRYKNNNVVIAFDHVNEPYHWPIDVNRVLRMYNTLIQAVRSVGWDKPSMINATYGDSVMTGADHTLITDRSNVIFSWHDYYSGDDGASNGYKADRSQYVIYNADGSAHNYTWDERPGGYYGAAAELEEHFLVNYNWARSAGLPFRVDEWGINPDGANSTRWIDDKVALYKKYGIGYTWWLMKQGEGLSTMDAAGNWRIPVDRLR